MSVRLTVIQRKRYETAPFPFRRKPAFVFHRLQHELSRFRTYKAAFPTVGMIDLGNISEYLN
jgi:hypothetical protein